MSSTTIPDQIAITAILVEPGPDPSQKYVDQYSVNINGDCLDKDEAVEALFPNAVPTTHRMVYDAEYHSIGPEGSNQRRSFYPSRGPGSEPFDPDVIGQQKVPGEIGDIYTLGSDPVSPLLSPVLSPIETPSVTKEKVTTTTTTTTQNRFIPASSPPASPPISRTYSPPLTPPDTPPVLSPPLVYSPPLDTSVAAAGVVTPPLVSPPLLSPIYSPPATSSVRNTSTYQTGVISSPAGQEVRTNYFA